MAAATIHSDFGAQKNKIKSVTTSQAAYVLSCFIRVLLFTTLWNVVHQALLSLEFSRQKYWSGLPYSSPEDFPNPGVEPRSPTLQVDSLLSEPPGMSVVSQRVGHN